MNSNLIKETIKRDGYIGLDKVPVMVEMVEVMHKKIRERLELEELIFEVYTIDDLINDYGMMGLSEAYSVVIGFVNQGYLDSECTYVQTIKLIVALCKLARGLDIGLVNSVFNEQTPDSSKELSISELRLISIRECLLDEITMRKRDSALKYFYESELYNKSMKVSQRKCFQLLDLENKHRFREDIRIAIRESLDRYVRRGCKGHLTLEPRYLTGLVRFNTSEYLLNNFRYEGHTCFLTVLIEVLDRFRIERDMEFECHKLIHTAQVLRGKENSYGIYQDDEAIGVLITGFKSKA